MKESERMAVFDKLCSGQIGETVSTTPTENTEPVEKTKRPTPKESEDDITEPYRHLGYKPQVSTITNPDGEIVEVAWGTKGSRRPDAINLDDPDHVKILEVKNYDITTAAGQSRLQNNIRKQTDKSIEHYGEDVEITEVMDLRGQPVTVGDMMDMCEKFEEKNSEVNWDYRM